MATYKEEHGTGIVKVTTDPTNPVNGQVWYNSTDQALKGFTSNPAGSWSTGGSLNTAARRGSGFGQKDSALTFGGYSGGATSRTEQYNGSSWTEVSDLNTARWDPAGAGYGDNTAGLCIGGQPGGGVVAINESWNGTSWTEVGNLNTARANGIGAGTETSALCFGGLTSGTPTDITVNTESWNGSAWTEVNDLNTAKRLGGAGGIDNTSALAFGGENSSTAYLANTESWNGTSWTEVADLNTAREALSGNGTLTSALASGGHDGTVKAQTESWNGTSWSEDTDLSTARERTQNNAGSNNTSALVSGGNGSPGSALTNTEEWVAPTETTVTFTTT